MVFGMKSCNRYAAINKKVLLCLWINVSQDLKALCEALEGKSNVVDSGETGKRRVQVFLFFLSCWQSWESRF